MGDSDKSRLICCVCGRLSCKQHQVSCNVPSTLEILRVYAITVSLRVKCSCLLTSASQFTAVHYGQFQNSTFNESARYSFTPINQSIIQIIWIFVWFVRCRHHLRTVVVRWIPCSQCQLKPKFHLLRRVPTRLDTLSSPCMEKGKSRDMQCRVCPTARRDTLVTTSVTVATLTTRV